jgi:predicted phosphoribosyltransferase
VRRAGPEQLVLAVPVADASVLARLEPEADRIVCLHVTPDLASVGQYYQDFHQLGDAEVVAMLSAADFRP